MKSTNYVIVDIISFLYFFILYTTDRTYINHPITIDKTKELDNWNIVPNNFKVDDDTFKITDAKFITLVILFLIDIIIII